MTHASQTPILRFVRGFLIGRPNHDIPPQFEPHPFPMPLFVSRHLDVGQARNDKRHTYLLGTAVDPDNPQASPDEICESIIAERNGRQTVIDRLIGRFAVVDYDEATGVRIQSDATAMRRVYFGYDDAGRQYACSHGDLARMAFGAIPTRFDGVMQWGFPGCQSSMQNLWRLPPNHEVSLDTGQIHRIFPTAEVPANDLETSWTEALREGGIALRAFAQKKPLLVSLTAGMDSRCTLASMDPQVRSTTKFFSYVTDAKSTVVDYEVAKHISKSLNLEHEVIDNLGDPADPEIMRIIAENTDTTQGHDFVKGANHRVAAAYYSSFGFDNYIHVRSNVLEIARSDLYRIAQTNGTKPLLTASDLAEYYRQAVRGAVNESVYIPAFDEMVNMSDWGPALSFASCWDLYFLEHRMGAWHGNVALEGDVAFETVVAFNSRRILSRFLGIAQEDRARSSWLEERLLGSIAGIEDVPINPSTWPLAQPTKRTAS